MPSHVLRPSCPFIDLPPKFSTWEMPNEHFDSLSRVATASLFKAVSEMKIDRYGHILRRHQPKINSDGWKLHAYFDYIVGR